MEWKNAFGPGDEPNLEQIAGFIGSPLWEQLGRTLRESYNVQPKLRYSGCAMQQGWNLNYQKSGKSLCTLYPMEGYFIALVVVGAKEMQEAELMLPLCTQAIQALFGRTSLYMGGKWLMIEVRDEEVLRDTLELIRLRAAKKR